MRILQWGSRGPSVQLLQLALNRAGYGTLETDGRFGSATREALLRFQRAQGLQADGIAGKYSHQTLLPWYTGYLTHRIQAGDSFWLLARRYGSTPEAIALANPEARPQNLQVGSELVIPLAFPVVPTTINWCSALTGYCVQGLTARYPFLRAGQIGKSVLGRPLWRLQLGSGENRVLYNAAHHANEWITTPLLLHFAEELAAAAAEGENLCGIRAAEILDYAGICLIPCVDPDGVDLVAGELQSGADYDAAVAIAGDYPRFPFPGGWKANIRGIDLNLQYPADWEQARENKFAQGIVSPAPEDYVGAGPLTAPESRALAAFTRSFDPALTLSYHSQGRVIYWRFQDYAPAGARKIAELFAQLSGYTVEDAPFSSGFAGYKDWFIQDFARPGFTIEVGAGQNPLPIEDFPALYEENRGILVMAALVT